MLHRSSILVGARMSMDVKVEIGVTFAARAKTHLFQKKNALDFLNGKSGRASIEDTGWSANIRWKTLNQLCGRITDRISDFFGAFESEECELSRYCCRLLNFGFKMTKRAFFYFAD